MLDLWHHPLLGAKWASLVKDIALCTQAMEIVLPADHTPRHILQGLAIFTLSLTGARAIPRIVIPLTPVLQLPLVNSIFIDTTPDMVLAHAVCVLATACEQAGVAATTEMMREAVQRDAAHPQHHAEQGLRGWCGTMGACSQGGRKLLERWLVPG